MCLSQWDRFNVFIYTVSNKVTKVIWNSQQWVTDLSIQQWMFKYIYLFMVVNVVYNMYYMVIQLLIYKNTFQHQKFKIKC